MKFKRRIILKYVIVAYTLVSLAINIGANHFNDWLGMMIGLSLMILAIPMHFIGKKQNKWYLLSFIFNSIGLGFSISTYYFFHELPKAETFFIVGLICFSIVLFFSFITLPKKMKPFVKLLASFIILILFIVSIVLWVKNDDSMYSLLFYVLNISYFYMVGMITANHNIGDLKKEMSVVSFGAFFIVSLIALIIVSEGEVLEGVGESFFEAVGEGIAELLPQKNKRLK